MTDQPTSGSRWEPSDAEPNQPVEQPAPHHEMAPRRSRGRVLVAAGALVAVAAAGIGGGYAVALSER